jgi:membrane associated rhomboid family serine protease
MRTYRTVSLNALWFLIGLNVVIFVIELIRPDALGYFALTPAYVPQQPWTILTAMFLHASFPHILFNMISLYFLGSLFLRVKGERSFFVVYFSGGLAGNLLYFLLGYLVLLGRIPSAFGSLAPAVGASGAIFAIGGALAVLVPRVPVYIFFIPIAMPLWVAILIFFGLSFLFAGIAWQAHLGGVLAGVIAGFLFRRRGQFHYF